MAPKAVPVVNAEISNPTVIAVGSQKRRLFRIPKDESAAPPKARSIFLEENDTHPIDSMPVRPPSLQTKPIDLASSNGTSDAPPAEVEPPAKARKIESGTEDARHQPAKQGGLFESFKHSAKTEMAAAPSPAKATAVTVVAAPPSSNSGPAMAKATPIPNLAPSATSASTNATGGKPGLKLEGVGFCFTGEMEMMSRQDAEDRVKMFGGKVMGVSGNLTYLVLGSRLEDGRTVEETGKYKKYVELKGKGKKFPTLLTETEFQELLPGDSKAATPAAILATSSSGSSAAAPHAAAATTSGVPKTSVRELSNWVDTHAPKGFGDLIGNQSVVRKLAEWLRDWDSVVLKGQTKKAAFKPGGGMPENINARAALLSGPPGIGKTTTAVLIAQQHGGYEVLQYNASDARGQKIIQEMADGIADNTTINFGGFAQKKPTLTRRAILIMDEVDGMGAGDRGGNAALIKMIKKTKNPIICICNDAHSPKIRSLAFSCYDLKFTRPMKASIAQRCAQIAQREGLEIEANALEALAESCGGDMRMVLNQLQMLSKSPMYKTAGVKYMDMKDKMHEMQKDQVVMVTPFDACKKLLNSSEGARMSFRDRLDMFFTDHSLVGLLVQENYLNAVKTRPVDAGLMARCAFSADLFTVGDVINNKIRENQDWSLLPDLAVAGAVYPAHVTSGFLAFPSFPSFLGKYSTMSKTHRLTTELHAHLRLKATVRGRNVLTSGYGDLLYAKMMKPLMSGNPDGVHETLAVLDAYGLRKEHLTEHLTELRQHLGSEDLFKVVDSKVKAAMTREFNSGAHGVKVALPTKKRKAAGSAEDVNPDDFADDDEKADDTAAPNADESDDDGAGANFIKVKAKGKAKGKAKPRGKAKAKA